MWEQLLGSGTDTLHAARGAPIFATGQAPKIALVGTGIIRVYVTTPLGRQLTIGYARAGELIGLAPALAHTDEWKAEAITDVTLTVLMVDQLHRAMEQSPELAWAVAEHLARLATDALRAIAGEAGQPTTVRIARHLREVSLQGVGGRLVAHISHQRLADAAGTVREVVSRELNALRRDGVIATTAGSVTIIDEDRLASIAAGRGY
jgi:CRP/FNR family cyclic AMP-dependent transcriptional regulator